MSGTYKWKYLGIVLISMMVCYGLINVTGFRLSSLILFKPMDVSIPFLSRDSSPPHLTMTTHDTCSHLLKTISFVGNRDRLKLYTANGCRLNIFKKRDTFQSCFNTGDRMAFIGDSRVRQLYCVFKALWTGSSVGDLMFHQDVVEIVPGLTFEFRWRPRVDSQMTDLLRDYLSGDKDKPTHIFVGAGVWRIRESNASESGLLNYQKELNKTVKYLLELKRHSDVIWLPQDPVDESRNEKSKNMISNSIIIKYNQIAKIILENNGISIFWSAYLAAQHLPDYYRNRVHLITVVDQFKVRILLNRQCGNKGFLDICQRFCNLS